MTLPAIQSADTTTATQVTNSASITVNTPGNRSNDDIICFIVGNDLVNPVTTGGYSTPTGLTLINANENDGIDASIYAYYIRVDGSESTSYTFTHSGTSQHFGFGLRITNVDTTTAIDVTGTDEADGTVSSGAPATVSALTTNNADALAISCLSFDGGDGDPFTGGGTGWPTTLSGADGGTIAAGTGGAQSSGCWAAKDVASVGTTEDCTLAPDSGAGTDGAVFFMFAFRGTAAVGGTNPKNPLGHPLHGAFGGPIGNA